MSNKLLLKLNRGVFVLRRALYTISTAAIILGGLTACNTNDNGTAGTKSYKDNARPIGYYSNENIHDRTDRNGNAYRLNDNDGPFTEMMDRNVNNNKFNRNNANNRKAGIMNDRNYANDTNLSDRQGIPFSDGNSNRVRNYGNDADLNYHGHLNNNHAGIQSTGNHDYDSALAKKIADKAAKVSNVTDARAVVSKNNVIIAVETSNNTVGKNLEHDVKKSVKHLTQGKNVHVVSDKGTFSRVRDIDNNIRNGNTPNTIGDDIRNLFDNIGNTIGHPFKNNR